MASLFKSCLVSAAFAASTLITLPAQANDREIDTATDLYKQALLHKPCPPNC